MELYDAFNGFIREMAGKKPTTEAKDNGSSVNDLPFPPNNALMWAPIHLTFLTRGMINWRRWAFIRLWPDRADIILEDGISSLIAEFRDLFQDPDGGKMLFSDQVAYFGLIRIELAGPMRSGRRIREGMGSSFEFSAYRIAANACSFGGMSDGTGFFEYFPNRGSLLRR